LESGRILSEISPLWSSLEKKNVSSKNRKKISFDLVLFRFKKGNPIDECHPLFCFFDWKNTTRNANKREIELESNVDKWFGGFIRV